MTAKLAPTSSKHAAFIHACYDGNLDVVKEYLARKDVDVPFAQGEYEVYDKDWWGTYGPLQAATRGGRFDVVQLLVEHGAPINPRSAEDTVPLSTAAAMKNLEIMQYLIEKGADINYEDPPSDKTPICGWTALYYSANVGHIEGIQFLMQHGASAHSSGFEMLPAYHVAEDRGFTEAAAAIRNFRRA